MENPKFITEGKHAFIAGSKKQVLGSHSFFSSETYMRVIHYDGDKLLNNFAFKTLAEMREWLAAEIYKLEMGNKLIPNHNLDPKSILVVNSNLNSPSGNKVRFYEVVELIDVCNVRLREVAHEVFIHGNYNTAIPSIGIYVDEKILERKVIANSVKIEENMLAMRLPFELAMVGGILPIKVYKPTSFGMKA